MAFVRNVGRVAENVKIYLKDGTPAYIRVMPRNKGVKLPEGATVCSRWHVQNGQNMRHFDTDTPAWSTNTKEAVVQAEIAAKAAAATATAATKAATAAETTTETTTVEKADSTTAGGE